MTIEEMTWRMMMKEVEQQLNLIRCHRPILLDIVIPRARLMINCKDQERGMMI